MEEDHEEIEDEEEEKPAKMKSCPLKKFDGKKKKADEELRKKKKEYRPAAAPAGRTEDSDMMTRFMAQLQSQFAKMETIMVSTLREENKTINDRIDDTNRTLRDGFKDQDEKHVISSRKLDVEANQMHEKFTKLTERLDALEQDTGSATPPVRAGGVAAELPSPGSARGSDFGPGPGRDPKGLGRVDPLQANDPWADFRRSRSGPGTSPLGSSPLGASPARRPSSPPEPERDFVPGAVYFKGWCRFKDPVRSLTRDDTFELGTKVLKTIENHPAALYVHGVQEPNLQNSRVVITVARGMVDGISKAMHVRSAITQRLEQKPVIVQSSELFAMVEPAPEKRHRDACIAKANAALEQCLPPDCVANVKLDVRAGSCYYAADPSSDRGLVEIGAFSSARRTWTWRPGPLAAAWPDLDVAGFERATLSLLAE